MTVSSLYLQVSDSSFKSSLKSMNNFLFRLLDHQWFIIECTVDCKLCKKWWKKSKTKQKWHFIYVVIILVIKYFTINKLIFVWILKDNETFRKTEIIFHIPSAYFSLNFSFFVSVLSFPYICKDRRT